MIYFGVIYLMVFWHLDDFLSNILCHRLFEFAVKNRNFTRYLLVILSSQVHNIVVIDIFENDLFVLQ